jgi:hypothetical protein
LLKTLDREENAAARGFFLTAWNGTTGYTFDRIIRGKTHIEAACLSLLGSTQPGRLAEYIRRAIVGGMGDDGLIQRFGLLVWPDQSTDWRDVDQYPETRAWNRAWETFRCLDSLTPETAGSQIDTFDGMPFLRFSLEAQELFREWRADLELRLRSGSMHPALESHLSKYRKLVPAVALTTHLADMGVGPISGTAMQQACALAAYSETHARRAYSAGYEAGRSAAKAILAHIRKGNLRDGFTARDIQRHDWSNLTARDQIQAGLDLLVDVDWLAEIHIKTNGRPKVAYSINPRGVS